MPDLDAFQRSQSGYEQFLALMMLVGALLAYFIVKHARTNEKLGAVSGMWMAILVGTAVRIPFLFLDYWYDESFTSVFVALGWQDMGAAIAGDVHPPLYYLIVKMFTTVLGHSEIVMRLPALIAGVLMIPAMYAIARDYGERTAIYCAWLTALMPAAVWYSAEARYPMLLALLLALAYIALQRRMPVVFVAALLASSLLHINAWLYVAVFALLWLIQRGASGIFVSMASSAGVAAWLPFALMQAGDVRDGFWLNQQMPLRHLIEMSILTRFDGVPAAIIPLAAWSALMFASVFLWRKRVTWAWLALAAGVPAIQTIITLFMPLYLPRTLLFSTMLLIVPMAWALANYRLRFWRFVTPALIAFALASAISADKSERANIVTLCEGFDTVYALNTASAIYASHYTSAQVVLSPHNPNSVAQTLPDDVLSLIWQIDDLSGHPDICVFAQVSVYSSSAELAHLAELSKINHVRHESEHAPGWFYVVMVFEERL